MDSQNWTTIAPIGHFWRPPDVVQAPFYVSNRTSIRPIPSWITSENAPEIDRIRPRICQTILEHDLTHCIFVEYQADALGTPDPNWRGAEPKSIQDSAVEEISLFTLSLWLTKPSGFHYQEIAHCEEHDSGWIVRQLGNYNRIYALPSYQYDQIASADIVRAKNLFEVLAGLPNQGPVWSAICNIGLALTQQHWVLRYLVFWLILEALFGPEDGREMTYRISQRIAFFLASDGKERRKLFDEIKESYKWRSKTVHGVRLTKLNSEKSEKLICDLERYVRAALLKVFDDSTLLENFSRAKREQFLDMLIYED